MNISITKEEYLAICSTIEVIKTDLIYKEKYFGSSDPEFVECKKQSERNLQAIDRVCEKYEETLYREKMIASLIAESKKQGRKITRNTATSLLRKYKVI